MAKRKCKHAFMLAMLRDGSTHRAFVVDIGRLPEPDYMDPDVLSIKCGDCHEQMSIGETSDDYEIGAWLPPSTSFLIERAASQDGWAWDPSRPVAGQYEESLNASVDEQLAVAKDKMRPPQGCECHQEAGDSACPVHPPDPAELAYAKSIGAPYQIGAHDPGEDALRDPAVTEHNAAVLAERNCPTCDSPRPHLHPAMQFEGEVQMCTDRYHQTVTAENTQASIDRLLAEQTRHDVAASVVRHDAFAVDDNKTGGDS